ncbi:MAG: hypothetical protein BRC40_14985 [Cyanobacteria bacterium QH_8_48_120]|nr:MAG: hypothetical protein BRC40_14985 [Cyanobacteria bacterium QH_8_48_120]
MGCSGSAPSEKSGLTFRSPISAQIGSWSDRTGGAISIAPNTPFRLRIRENHQLFDGKHSWKVSTLFQNLEATQHQVLRHQRFSLWTRPSPLYRAQSGLQIRAVLEGSTVFVLYLGSCLNLTSVQESKERSRIV